MKPIVTFVVLFGSLTVPCALVAQSGNSLLAVSPDGARLLVANPDNGTATLVDTAGRKSVREIRLGTQPESVAWIGAGPKFVATAYRDNTVIVGDAETGKALAKIPTAAEPYGVVVDRAGKRAFVTNEYPGLVTVIDLEALKVARTIPVGPFVRGVALAAEEKTLLVTHFYSGAVSIVDVAAGKVVDEIRSAGTSDNLARAVAVHPTKPLAYMPQIRSRVERAHGAGSIFPYVTVLDLVPPTQEKRRHTVAMDQFNDIQVTTNTWAVAASPDGKRVYAVHSGTDDMNVANVVDEPIYLERVGRLTEAGSNPRAVAVSPDSKTVYVYATLDFTVRVYQADPFRQVAKIKVCEPPYSAEILDGKKLFNLAKSPMSRLRWISCSSCHPDGDHDGRTWQQPEGLRRSTHFFGMSRTYPLHWSADRDELQDFEHTIRGPLMQGYGLLEAKLYAALGEPNAGRSKSLDALAAYCNSLEPALSPHAESPGKLSAAATRGKELFFAKETKCAECHSGPMYTDRKTHDVGTGRGDKTEKMGFKYDTPSLVRTYRNVTWLHDGSAKTLRDVLTTNPGDKHGKTSHLSPTQTDDLVEFMKSLPYER